MRVSKLNDEYQYMGQWAHFKQKLRRSELFFFFFCWKVFCLQGMRRCKKKTKGKKLEEISFRSQSQTTCYIADTQMFIYFIFVRKEENNSFNEIFGVQECANRLAESIVD